MALQVSGPISMNDMNTDRAIASGTQIDLASAGTAYSVSYATNGSDDLQFSEFYGKSAGAPPTPSYHVLNLYRSAGDAHPACSTTPAAQVIPYDSNYAIGVVFKGSNGFCYTIANDGFQVSPANITLSEEFGLCTDCTETAPPPTAPPPTPVVYYYNATRCHDNLSQIVYGGGNYYGTGTVVISGGTTYCYTIQNEVGATSYDDTVGASVDNCNNASCFGAPPPTTPPTAPPPTAPPPTAPSVTLDWYAVAGPNGPCGTGAFSVTKNSTAMVNVLLSSSQSGNFSVIAGDVLVITMIGGASGQDCSNPYVEYSGNQFASDSQTGLGPVQAQITVTVSAGDILNGSIVIGGTLDGALIPS